jgi:hypothetical protein
VTSMLSGPDVGQTEWADVSARMFLEHARDVVAGRTLVEIPWRDGKRAVDVDHYEVLVLLGVKFAHDGALPHLVELFNKVLANVKHRDGLDGGSINPSDVPGVSGDGADSRRWAGEQLDWLIGQTLAPLVYGPTVRVCRHCVIGFADGGRAVPRPVVGSDRCQDCLNYQHALEVERLRQRGNVVQLFPSGGAA